MRIYIENIAGLSPEDHADLKAQVQACQPADLAKANYRKRFTLPSGKEVQGRVQLNGFKRQFLYEEPSLFDAAVAAVVGAVAQGIGNAVKKAVAKRATKRAAKKAVAKRAAKKAAKAAPKKAAGKK